jgi:hypothetical protein
MEQIKIVICDECEYKFMAVNGFTQDGWKFCNLACLNIYRAKKLKQQAYDDLHSSKKNRFWNDASHSTFGGDCC